MSVFASSTLQAFIVGGNRGIGLEFVRQLLANPQVSHVYASHRQVPSPDLLQLTVAHPDRLTLLSLDITDETQIQQAISHIQTQTDRLQLVINCVGILHETRPEARPEARPETSSRSESSLQPEKSLQQIQSDRLLRYFQVNSIGAVLLAKHLLPLLKLDRSVYACISAKIGSIGDNQIGGWYGYRASKAALNMFIRTAAIEYSRKAPKAILVLLHPGTTDTQLSRPFQRNVPPEKLFSPQRTVSQLLSILENLQPEDSGSFFSWDGSRLPW
ncbi:MAG: SDR family NAD(P)-dependent oxidoreductase [Elainella sp. Prado103]|nr:SDR family NAD(P)-dependent oxidoreductase [Elainella sp. Prado103]